MMLYLTPFSSAFFWSDASASVMLNPMAEMVDAPDTFEKINKENKTDVKSFVLFIKTSNLELLL
ncbi:hypothetical protein R0K18_14860 [Pantoea sp. SIMBA_133]